MWQMPISMKRIALFASGRGSNAAKIIEHFRQHRNIEVSLIVSNKSTAGVLELAEAEGIPHLTLKRQDFYHTENILAEMAAYPIDFIALAGFLWLIPSYLVRNFDRAIVNIHPALLPQYGGKGMYGHHVHQAVWEAQEKESGMTIHYVNEAYDEGSIIFQARCSLDPTDSPDDIARKVLQLEHTHYAEVIENILLNNDTQP